MGLDYSQKRLFNIVLRRRGKGRGQYATLSSMSTKRKQRLSGKLEIYAFWMGFASTIISLLQVIIIAIKN